MVRTSASSAVATPRRAIVRRAAIAIVVVVLASRVWFIFHRAFDVDEFEHAHATWCVALGMIPYRDFFEHHTPALYYAFSPLFHGPVDRSADIALQTLLLCRAAMLTVTIVIVAGTCRLGAMWRDSTTGAVAAVLLATSQQFLDSMLEFRPDVPAVLATLSSVLGAAAIGRSRSPGPVAFLSGALFGIALLFTQKAVFVGPGILLSVVAWRRWATTLAWIGGVAIPIASTLAWFARHDALEAFLLANVAFNAQLNADSFSTAPRLIRHIAHHPALYLCGFAGVVAALRVAPTRTVPFATAITAASLLAGAFVVGKAYDQYYALVLPLLAVCGAGWIDDGLRARPIWSKSRYARHAPWIAAGSATCAFVAIIRPLTLPANMVMAAFFSASALLAAASVQWWGTRRTAASVLALCSLAALLVGNATREFKSNRQQIADLRWVANNTEPTDSVLSGYQSVALFRPHAWFYFFLTGPFPSDADYASLLAQLEAGRIRPRLVVLNATLATAPEPVLQYIHGRYRRVRGDLFERVEP